jgi:hypothetical protein
MHQRIMPSVQDAKTRNLDGLPLSDSRVAALSTQPRGVTPLTLQLANPEAGTKYWVISSRGVNEKPLVGTGTLTGSELAPISAADLAKWSKQFGELAEGAPVISARGDLVAFLGTSEGSGRLGAVSSSHIANDLRTFGLSRDSSPIDAQFQDGLELFEASQFAAAVPKLKAAVAASGGQRVARQLLAQSEAKSGTAEDLSDEADLLSSPGEQSDGWSTLAIALFSALVILVLIGVGIAIAMARRRSWPDEDDGEEPGEGTHGGPGAGRGDDRSASPGSDAGSGAGSGAGAGAGSSAGTGAGTGAGLNPRTAEVSRAPVAAGTGSARRAFAPITPGPAGAEGPPNGHPSRPTTLFATGTTDPKPAAQQARRVTPVTDPGEAPTEKRASGQPAGPARPDAPQRPSGGFCRQCGSQLSPGDRFCFSCGTPAGSSAGKG